MRRDYPTSHRQGSWVSTGDSAGTRFFIPRRGGNGLSSQQLTAEALAAMHPSKKARLEEELKESDAKDAVETATEITWLLVGAMAGAY